MASILLVGWDNRAGTSRDLSLVERVLREAGHRVAVRGLTPPGLATRLWIRIRQGCPYDLALYLERLVAGWMPLARRNVLIPNPEWLDPATPRLSDVDAIWCKTSDAMRRLAGLGRPLRLVGFTGRDLGGATETRRPGALHVAGRSQTKGTPAVLAAWARHPEWPTLTVVAWKERVPLPGPFRPNIRIVDHYLDEAVLTSLQRATPLHVCPSEAEGYGHTILEGLSAGALVVTTDAPPMNELVTPERGILVAAEPGAAMALGQRYLVGDQAVEAALSRAMALSEASRRSLAAAGRSWFVANDAEFRRRLAGAVEAMLA